MPRLGRGGATPAPQGKVEARTPEAAVSGFAGRGVGVGDDRGKGTPNFVHPFSLSAPPSFHFCPGLPLFPAVAISKFITLGFASSSPFCYFILPSLCCLLLPAFSLISLGFPLPHLTPEPDGTLLPALASPAPVLPCILLVLIPSSCHVSPPSPLFVLPLYLSHPASPQPPPPDSALLSPDQKDP